MKLLDILARELKEWPRTYMGTATEAVSQDAGGDLNNLDDGSEAHINQMLVSFWSGSDWSLNGITLEEAEDYKTAIVTRAQWQAAVDALKVGEQVWDGESKPPVGTVCEVPDGPDFREATIIAYYKDMAVFAFDDEDGHPYVETCLPLECRRIRTAEQIAADEREEGIRQLQIDHGVRARDGGRVIAEKLWDLGYRKQVQP